MADITGRSLVADVALGYLIACIAYAVYRAAKKETSPPTPQTGFGPVEPVSDRPYTDPIVTPTPGTQSLEYTTPTTTGSGTVFVPDEATTGLCAGAPINSFGPACHGVTWVAASDAGLSTMEGMGITVDRALWLPLTAQQVARISTLDPSLRWFGFDLRQNQ